MKGCWNNTIWFMLSIAISLKLEPNIIEAIHNGGTVVPPKETTAPIHLPCYFCQYGTKNKETFCNKTVKICDEDKPNCLSYNYFYRNNTRVFGKGCGGDNDCKNTSKTCEDFVKKNQDVSACTMSCCEEPRCNRGTVQLTHHLLTFILVLFSGTILRYMT